MSTAPSNLVYLDPDSDPRIDAMIEDILSVLESRTAGTRISAVTVLGVLEVVKSMVIEGMNQQ